MLTAIRQWVIRTMMKSKGETGIVKTIPKRDIVEINTQITAQRLMENGIDPMSLKNADQVENAIIAIENRPKVQQGIGSTKSADVFDLKGKKIKNPDNIIGGEELPPPGSRGGPDDIAAPVQSSEKTMKNMIEDELMKSENPFSDLVKTTKQGPKTIKEREAEILARMEKDNKAAVQRIKNRKMLDDAIDNASPGFVKGDRKYNAQLVADDLAEKKFGKDFDDLDQKQQMDLYGEALDGLDDLDKFAQGGRAGFKTGLGKRFLDFLKGLKKEKPFSGKEFVDKRKFIGADKIENKIQMMKNKKVLEEARKEFKKNPPFKFPEPGSKEYDEALARVQRALIEDRKLNAEGGRAGYFTGGLMKLLKAASKTSPKQAYTKYLKSVKDRAQKGDMKSLAPELGAVSATGIFVNRRMKDVLENMKNQDMENTLENYIKELDADPFYEEYPELKDKMIEGYTEMMFGEKRADGGRIGYFMGSANPRGLGLLREILNYMSKTGKELDKFKGADLSALDMLRLSNPKALNRLLEDVRGKVNVREGIMGTDTVRAQQQALREKRKGITAAALEVAKDMKARDIKIKRQIAEEAEYTIIPQMKKQLMEGMGMSEETAEKTARGMAEAAQNIRLTNDPPIITKEGLLQLENVLKNLETGGKKKRELNATGGRIGFKEGMTRRTFLKLFAGLASIPIIGKIVKPLKTVKGVKKVPIIKTDNVPGKPEWFDQLVNKVIIEGDDVTKKFATGERQSIHQKTLDDGSVVRVTEDVDDGAVRVEYESQESMFGEPVQMEYKKPLPDEGAPSPAAQFEVSESGIVSRADGPDDFVLESEGVSGTSIRDLDSDVSALKQYATGKGPTMKEIVEIKKRKDKVKRLNEGDSSETSQYISDRQGDYDPSPDDFASGGIARMLGE